MPSSDLPRLLRATVKSVHRYIAYITEFVVSCPTCTKNLEWYLLMIFLSQLINLWLTN